MVEGDMLVLPVIPATPPDIPVSCVRKVYELVFGYVLIYIYIYVRAYMSVYVCGCT